MLYFRSFFWGILGALGALVGEAILTLVLFSENQPPSFELNLKNSFFIFIASSVIVEELVKALLVSKIFDRIPDKPAIIPQSILLGAGFSCVEISFHATNFFLTGETIAFFPLLQLFLVHATTALLAGLFLLKIGKKFSFSLLSIIALNSLLHFVYNYFTLTN